MSYFRVRAVLLSACVAVACNQKKEEKSAKATIDLSVAKETQAGTPKSDPNAANKEKSDADAAKQAAPAAVAAAVPAALTPGGKIVRLGETGQNVFPSLKGAPAIDSSVAYTECASAIYQDGKKVVRSGYGVAFCVPGAVHAFIPDYRDPPPANAAVRSLTLFKTGDLAKANATEPWFLIDLEKQVQADGRVSLVTQIWGSHDFAKQKAGSSFAAAWAYGVAGSVGLDADGSIADSERVGDDLVTTENDIATLPLKVRFSKTGSAGTLEVEFAGQKTLVEPKWVAFDDVIDAAEFALPKEGRLVQSGDAVSIPGSYGFGAPSCPAGVFAPLVWSSSITKKMQFCWNSPLTNESVVSNELPVQREFVAVRYDVGAADKRAASSTRFLVDSCDASFGAISCTVTIESEFEAITNSVEPGQAFRFRGLSLEVTAASGRLTGIKIRKPGETIGTAFLPKLYPQ